MEDLEIVFTDEELERIYNGEIDEVIAERKEEEYQDYLDWCDHEYAEAVGK